MSRPLIRSGQWSQTTTGKTQPAARLKSMPLVRREIGQQKNLD